MTRQGVSWLSRLSRGFCLVILSRLSRESGRVTITHQNYQEKRQNEPF